MGKGKVKRGRKKGNRIISINDECVCPICGARIHRRKGIQCGEEQCPDCGYQRMKRLIRKPAR